jgi:hypothetical protein
MRDINNISVCDLSMTVRAYAVSIYVSLTEILYRCRPVAFFLRIVSLDRLTCPPQLAAQLLQPSPTCHDDPKAMHVSPPQLISKSDFWNHSGSRHGAAMIIPPR